MLTLIGCAGNYTMDINDDGLSANDNISSLDSNGFMSEMDNEDVAVVGNNDNETDEHVDGISENYDEAKFFIKPVEYAECTELYICYRHPDGLETDIVMMGLQTSPQLPTFQIFDGYIYFVQGDAIHSVDFTGKNSQYFYDSSDANYTFDRIIEVKEGWLYCCGTKWQEVYEDSYFPDEVPCRIPAYTKVKADFTEFMEIPFYN
jgi:hypothetical protein